MQIGQKKCLAAGIVVLCHGGQELPSVVVTKQQTGRDGKPPKWELPSGHVDPLDASNPSGARETPEVAARREVLEEAGARLGWITLYALRLIRNPKTSKYPPKSHMAYYVGFAEELVAPTDLEHERRVVTLQQIGDLVRTGDMSADEAKIIRAGVIAFGYSEQRVLEAVGPLKEPG